MNIFVHFQFTKLMNLFYRMSIQQAAKARLTTVWTRVSFEEIFQSHLCINKAIVNGFVKAEGCHQDKKQRV